MTNFSFAFKGKVKDLKNAIQQQMILYENFEITKMNEIFENQCKPNEKELSFDNSKQFRLIKRHNETFENQCNLF